jgi:hypothetical protein
MRTFLDALTKNDRAYLITVDEPLTPSGARGEGRFVLIESEVAEGVTGISGWAVVPVADDRFLTCSIVADRDAIGETLPALRAMFAAMRLRSLESVEREQRAKAEAGAKAVAFSEDVLRSAIRPEPILYRMYRPATRPDGSDETELGWLTLRAIEGMRGEVDASRSRDELKGDDLESGLLVVMQAKMIVGGDPTNTIDSDNRFWVSWDRSSELWSGRNTQRQKEASRTTSETGIRTPALVGEPRPMLRVLQSTADRRTRDPLEWPVPANYLSQAELLVLGRLMTKRSDAPAEFASVAFDPRTRTLADRLDAWRRNPDGTWTLETRLGGAAAPLVQTFDRDGERIRRVDTDATGTIVTERVTLDELRSIWRRKGLPVE